MAFAPKSQPIPRTRKYRGGGYGYMKRPKTAAEHKLNQVIDREEPKCRPKRGAGQLVDAWDDYARTIERTWKKFRRQQCRR